MIGIVDIEAYIPNYRLPGSVVSTVWGKKAKGERAVANYDEDSITMAVGALLNLDEKLVKELDGLYFASSTFPYAEKTNTAVVATAVDLKRNARIADFGNSLRSGLAALGAAFDAVESGSAGTFGVAAADVRKALPGSNEEIAFGDAGAALIVGKNNLIAELKGRYSCYEDFFDSWRFHNEDYVFTGDARFSQVYGYEALTDRAVKGLMEQSGITLQQVSKVVFYAPDDKTYAGITKKLGLSQEQTAECLLNQIGNSGNSMPLIHLANVLANSCAGDLVVMVGYGDGAEAYLFQVTDNISKKAFSLQKQISTKRLLENYGRFLAFREMVAGEKIVPFSSEIQTWREKDFNLRLHAPICNKCGAVQIPPRRICWNCDSMDDFHEIPLKRSAKVITFTKDTLVPTPDPPVIMVVADLDSGGRFYTQLTDCDPKTVQIGTPVELTFRKYHEGAHFYNYFWKFRPADGREA